MMEGNLINAEDIKFFVGYSGWSAGQLKGELELTSYEPEGIEIVKEALKKAKGAEVKYKGAGVYNVTVKAPDYKEAEKILEKATEAPINHIEKNKGKGKFTRIE